MAAPQPRRPRATAPDPQRLREEQQRTQHRATAEALNQYEVKAHVDDQTHTFRFGDVSAADVAALRAATGTTVIDPVLNMLQYFAPDMTVVALDKLAELVFLARRQAGERCTFDEVADSITGRSKVSLDYPEGEMPHTEEAQHLDPPPSDGS